VESPTLNALDPWPQTVTWRRVSGRLIAVELISEAIRTLFLAMIAAAVWVFTESRWALIAGAAVLAWGLIRSYVIVRAVRSYGYAERERDLLVRHGRLIRRLSIVPYARMQFVDVTAGPLDRAFRLATLRLHTAAAASDAVIPGLAPQEATRLRDRLAALGEDQGEGL
jgi:membrane protein YdbS with pleckstrin-like domain